jgi:transcriptional regulator with XRE-family HTH domain
MYMTKQVRPRFKSKNKFTITHIRAWRKYRGLTLARLADRVGTTHATLSRIERGKQPYNQPLLEAIADALQTDPGALLTRNPEQQPGILTVLENADPATRQQILDIAITLTTKKKTGT